MFFLWKKKEESIYPGFISRILSSVIDVGLAAIIIIPICAILYSVIYDGNPPSKQLAELMNQAYGSQPDVNKASESLHHNAEYIKFMREKGYRAIFLEQLIQVALLAACIFIAWVKMQSTPGKTLLSMKIVDEKTMGVPTIKQYILRIIGYIISIIPLGFGIFYILLNKKRRAFHDLIAGTVVISSKKISTK